MQAVVVRAQFERGRHLFTADNFFPAAVRARVDLLFVALLTTDARHVRGIFARGVRFPRPIAHQHGFTFRFQPSQQPAIPFQILKGIASEVFDEHGKDVLSLFQQPAEFVDVLFIVIGIGA